jgi:hypothetical protein
MNDGITAKSIAHFVENTKSTKPLVVIHSATHDLAIENATSKKQQNGSQVKVMRVNDNHKQALQKLVDSRCMKPPSDKKVDTNKNEEPLNEKSITTLHSEFEKRTNDSIQVMCNEFTSISQNLQNINEERKQELMKRHEDQVANQKSAGSSGSCTIM